MALNDNIYFTSSNLIESSDVSASADPATSIDWLKNSKRARQTRWVNPDGDIEIDFVFEEAGTISYFAIPGHDLPDTASVQFIAYDASDSILHDTGFNTVGSLKPAGEFIAGVDQWNTTVSSLQQIVFQSIDPVLNATHMKLIINHGYVYEEVDPTTTTTTTTVTTSDETLRQDDSGVVSVEAESCEFVGSGGDSFTQVADTDASGGQAMYKSGSQFYSTAGSGPLLRFNFTAAESGAHKIWLRLKSVDGNSIYTSFDGSPTTSIFVPYASFINDTWQWKNTKTVNLIAGVTHTVEISARDHYIYIDKIVIQPSGDDAPTGDGPDESDYGTITTDTVTGETITQVFQNFVNLRMVMTGEILQLQENFEYGAAITFLSDATNYTVESGFTVVGKTGSSVRTLSLNLAVMNDRDRRVLVQLQEKMRGRAFIVSAYPNSSGWIASKHTFLAKFDNGSTFSHDRNNIHSTNITLNEV